MFQLSLRQGLKACCNYQSFPSKTWSKLCVVTIKVFLMIGQRKGGNSMLTKSKMAPVNISQNDYLALSLCLLCITILRRWIRHRTTVGKKADKILVLSWSLSQYSFDFIFHITDLASTISINSSITSFVHTFLVLEAILQIQLFPRFLPCAFCLVNKIASFQNSTLIG